MAEGLKADYRISTLVSQPVKPAMLREMAKVRGMAACTGLDSQVLQRPAGIDPLSVYGVGPSAIGQLIVVTTR